MKTAISVPDDTYERVERVAKSHGMKRSQFYAEAADRYADALESAEITAAIDAVVDEANADEPTQVAVAAGRRVLDEDDGAW